MLINHKHQITATFQHDFERDGLINPMLVVDFDKKEALYVHLSIQREEGVCEYLNLAEVIVMSKCEEGDACFAGLGSGSCSDAT
jgi:hypothetical protein